MNVVNWSEMNRNINAILTRHREIDDFDEGGPGSGPQGGKKAEPQAEPKSGGSSVDSSHWGNPEQQDLLVSAMQTGFTPEQAYDVLNSSPLTQNEDPQVLRAVAQSYQDMQDENTNPNDMDYIQTNENMIAALNAIADSKEIDKGMGSAKDYGDDEIPGQDYPADPYADDYVKPQ